MLCRIEGFDIGFGLVSTIILKLRNHFAAKSPPKSPNPQTWPKSSLKYTPKYPNKIAKYNPKQPPNTRKSPLYVYIQRGFCIYIYRENGTQKKYPRQMPLACGQIPNSKYQIPLFDVHCDYSQCADNHKIKYFQFSALLGGIQKDLSVYIQQILY